MDILANMAQVVIGYIKTIGFFEILDIAIVAYLVYRLLSMIRSTDTERILKGIAVFLLALWLSSVMNLQALNFLLSHLMEWGVLALIILFQPEIRRLLEQMGTSNLGLKNIFHRAVESSVMEQAIDQVTAACVDMANRRVGALIVFEREQDLDDILRSGTRLDAETSSELLKNLFFINAPMHDGAVLIRQGRVLGAGCMLPLSKNMNLSRDLGMRHRAGIGVSESTDAVVVLVSEETGSISCAVGGMLKRHLTAETLVLLLRNELLEEEKEKPQKFSIDGLIQLLHSNKGGAQK